MSNRLWTMEYGLDNRRKDSGWWAAKTIGHPCLWDSYQSKPQFMKLFWRFWMILHLHGWKPMTSFDNLSTLGWEIDHGLDNNERRVTY